MFKVINFKVEIFSSLKNALRIRVPFNKHLRRLMTEQNEFNFDLTSLFHVSTEQIQQEHCWKKIPLKKVFSSFSENHFQRERISFPERVWKAGALPLLEDQVQQNVPAVTVEEKSDLHLGKLKLVLLSLKNNLGGRMVENITGRSIHLKLKFKEWVFQNTWC